MGPGHTMTMPGQGLLLLAVNWDFRPSAARRIRATKVGVAAVAAAQPKAVAASHAGWSGCSLPTNGCGFETAWRNPMFGRDPSRERMRDADAEV